MNQRQAGNILRRNAPKGEHPAFINQQEASWLKGMGGSGRPTKSGLRSYDMADSGMEDSQWSGGGYSAGTGESVSGIGYGSGSGDPYAGDQSSGSYGGDYSGDNYGSGSYTGGYEGQDPSSNPSPAESEQQPGETAEAYHNRMTGGGGDGGSGGSGGAGGSGFGSGIQTRNNTSSSISEIDKPTHEFRKKVYDKSAEIMDRPYQTYGEATGTMTDASGLTEGQEGYDPETARSVGGNQRFADASQDTLTAQQGIRDLQGQGQQAYTDASNVGKDVSGYQAEQVGGGNFLQGQAVGDYMNPHTSNVIGGLQDQAMKSMQMGRNQLGAQAQMAGAGMGSRSAIEKGVMAGEVMSNLNRQTGELLNKSFADASAQKRADMKMNQDAQRYNQQAGMQAQDVRLRGARGMTDATGAGRQAGYQDAQMLSKVGADIEGRDQRQKDFDYDEYIEGRDWDKNNAMFASNVLSGAPVGTTTTQNNPMYRNQQGDRFGRAMAGAGAGWLAGGPYGALAGGAMGYFS